MNEPGGTALTTAVENHATGAPEVVATLTFYCMLCEDVTGAEEDLVLVSNAD
jgi:hypothetical protein